MITRTAGSALLALALGLVATGCSDDGADVRSSSGSVSGSTSGSGSGSGSSSTSADCVTPATGAGTVAVTMDEYSMQAEPTTMKAGRLSFAVTNDGEQTHELVVVKTKSAAELPRVTSTDPATNSAVDEDKLPPGTFVGEVEGVPAGKTCGGSFALAAGSYVLFCNIVEEKDGQTVNHFDLGMKTAITVT